MKKAVRIALIILLSITWCKLSAQSVKNKRYGIYMSYVKGYSLHANDDISSNVVKIYNNTDKKRQFTLRTVGPVDWVSMGKNERTLNIEPRDSAFVPVRVLPITDIKGGKVVNFKTSLYNDGMLISTATWIIETEIIHDWTANIVKNENYFLHDEVISNVQVEFSNKGNIDEKIQLDYLPSRLLEVVDQDLSEVIILKEGRDTTINVKVKIVEEEPSTVELFEKSERSLDKYTLKVKAMVQGAAMNPWQRSATFIKVRTEYEANEMNWENLPLTIDFQSYDLLSENPYASLGLYGMKRFDDERFMTYNFQFMGSTGEYGEVKSTYQNVAYYGRSFQAQIGDLTNNNHSGISMQGKGVSATKRFGELHSVSGLYTLNSEGFSKIGMHNYSFDYSFKSKENKFNSSIYAQYQDNTKSRAKKALVGMEMSQKFLKTQQLTVQGNLSEHSDTILNGNDALSGYDVKAAYTGRLGKKLYLGANYQFTTVDFVSNSGVDNIKAYMNYSIDAKQGLFSHYIKRNYSPNVWSNGELIQQGMRSKQDEAKVTYRYKKDNQSFNLFGQYNTYEVPNYLHNWYGGGIDYLFNLSLYSRLNTSLFLWHNEFSVNPDDPYTTIQFNMSYRKKNFRISGVYYYGARYMLEHIEYAETEIVPRSYFVNSNYEFWANDRVLINVASNLNYRSSNDRLQVNVRPTFDYFVAQGFKLKGYASAIVYNQGERIYEISNDQVVSPAYTEGRFEMGLGFVKDIGIPLSRKNNFDIKFIAFSDHNGNGVKDGNEESIPNMLIIAEELDNDTKVEFSSFVEDLEVITNQNGEAALLNVDKGVYSIESHPLQKSQSWFSDRTFSVNVQADQTIYLPQSKGGRIYGSIQLEIADYSRFERGVSVENIRVSAIDSSGFEYNCLTDGNGAFVLNAPMGTYNLFVSQELFSGSFELSENNIPVTIDNRYSNVQRNFFVKEKSRKIVVKKFGASATEEVTPVVESNETITKEESKANKQLAKQNLKKLKAGGDTTGSTEEEVTEEAPKEISKSEARANKKAAKENLKRLKALEKEKE